MEAGRGWRRGRGGEGDGREDARDRGGAAGDQGTRRVGFVDYRES